MNLTVKSSDPGGNHRLSTAWARWSLGTQLLIAVNVPLAVVLAILLVLDYRREMADAVAQKHRSLNDEAMMIYHSLYFLGRQEGSQAIQRYLDAIRGHVEESGSPDHHIAIHRHGEVLQARHLGGRSSDNMKEPRRADGGSDNSVSLENQTSVVGSFSGRDAVVYVSEDTTSIRRSIQQNILFHLLSLVLLALAAASIVNPLLWRTVTRPMRRLSRAVAGIAAGNYGTQPDGFYSRELNELSKAIKTMGESLAANERSRRSQMAQAHRIQEHLLPQQDVKIPFLAVARVFAPADAVAGDYYDLIPLPDDTWLICVADVTGHGIPAALGSVILKTLVLGAAEQLCDPGQILRYVNRRLAVLLPDQFASMFLGRWHPESHRLSYSSAGHEPGLLVLRDGGSRSLMATGPLLGIDDTTDWETESIGLHPGERILLTTDGVAEARSPDSRLFGRERLAQLVADSVGLPLEDVVRAICEAVFEHQAGESPTDDLTILLIEPKAPDSV